MRHWFGRSVLAALVLLAASCTERSLVGPDVDLPGPETPPPVPDGAMVLVCTAAVASADVACLGPAPKSQLPVQADRIIGGQDVYVRLTNTGTAYDAGRALFTTNVTVQNLTQQLLGTTDGLTAEGVRVFFASGPSVSTGSGIVSINADGTGVFLADNQPYMLYNQILEPLEISDPRLWTFNVDNTVETFTFTVYVSAPMIDETVALLGSVWSGAESTGWPEAPNWVDGNVPDGSSAVTIPILSLLASGAEQPILVADVAVNSLRVGTGSTVDLAGFTVTVTGNVDAVGPISDGHVIMSGAAAILGGTVPHLRVTGNVKLQRPTRATGAVVVSDGSLTVTDLPLTISIP